MIMSDRNISVTLECFIKKDGRYLMLHRNENKKIIPGVWMAPGGHREFNEGLFEAARREIHEETGLQIKNIQLKAVGNAYLKDLDKELYFSMLVADYESGDLKTNISDGEFSWLSKEEILNLENLLEELKKIIPHILSDNKEVISYKAVYEKANIMSYFTVESKD